MKTVLCFTLALTLCAGTLQARGALYGMVLVVDAGHGGLDPGSHGYFPQGNGRVLVVEDEYVADVARRLTRIAKAHGAIVINTTRDTRQVRPIAIPPQQVIPPDQNEVYTSTGKRVRAGNNGLKPRTDVANASLQKYPRHIVVFVSLHFDSNGSRDLAGVHMVGPKDGNPRILALLAEEFRKERLLRSRGGAEYHPITRSGDRAHGVRDLFVLRGTRNQVPSRVLIELGNFGNPSDVWRLRNHTNRERYAQVIVRALMRLK